ncbi:MAG TPA: glycosyltransferase family 2 protein [Polyangiaceae bacterium]|nr:glycosyltransferase family 2 protein [Polyangiaceae bacterium]
MPQQTLRVVIVVPTYNEAENIRRLIPALQQQFATLSHDMNVLVVDDNSPDGTADVVRSLQVQYPNVFMIQGQKAGLGAAYRRGMLHALEELAADVVFEMDADFSHKPEDVPRLLAEIDAGADCVIGSRYVKGGSIPSNWGFMRKANSWGGNLVARWLAGIYRIRDCTAGFRAIRARNLREVDLETTNVQGYAFQVALLHALVTRGARTVEIPVEFIDRTAGESKLGLSDIVEFIANAWWIRVRSSATFLRFLAVGASGVVVNLAFFTLFLRFGLHKYLASPIAIEISIISNFVLNNYWTFGARKVSERTGIRGLKFNAVSLLSLSVSYGIFVLLTLTFPNVAPQVHQLVGIVPATVVNYLLNNYWTFRRVEA